ncbi:MAG: succinate dehydrogenase, hydrophobic membrane anchor protein [Candidatus Aminicenantes bacterium]|nr:succinate dehydrogenase, hydrophobic membrane anchor protein [Candidatus Aminicenantes bacterium]
MKKNFKETSKTGARVWLFQRISAIILFVLLILHFVTYHFINKGIIKYTDIMEKMKSPWFNLIQFIFLLTAVYHGFNGIWMMVEDYVHPKLMRIVLFGIIVIIAFCLLFIGMLTIFKVSNL